MMGASQDSYQRLLNHSIPGLDQTWSIRDTLLYALGVGLGYDPMDSRQLRFVYEKDVLALPTMVAVICAPHGWVRRADVGFGSRMVAGELAFTLHMPLPVEGEFRSQPRLARVVDQGEGKGALITAAWDLADKKTGQRIAELEATTFCRGDGGFGGPRGPAPAPHVLPASAPEFVCDLPTLPQAALLYRLSGDYSAQHADPEVAQRVGFPRPILHGLGTLAVAGHALLKTVCNYEPHRLKSMRARFSAPVYPGDTLRTEMWKNGRFVSFRTTVPDRNDEVVINNGLAEIHPDIA